MSNLLKLLLLAIILATIKIAITEQQKPQQENLNFPTVTSDKGNQKTATTTGSNYGQLTTIATTAFDSRAAIKVSTNKQQQPENPQLVLAKLSEATTRAAATTKILQPQNATLNVVEHATTTTTKKNRQTPTKITVTTNNASSAVKIATAATQITSQHKGNVIKLANADGITKLATIQQQDNFATEKVKLALTAKVVESLQFTTTLAAHFPKVVVLSDKFVAITAAGKQENKSDTNVAVVKNADKVILATHNSGSTDTNDDSSSQSVETLDSVQQENSISAKNNTLREIDDMLIATQMPKITIDKNLENFVATSEIAKDKSENMSSSRNGSINFVVVSKESVVIEQANVVGSIKTGHPFVENLIKVPETTMTVKLNNKPSQANNKIAPHFQKNVEQQFIVSVETPTNIKTKKENKIQFTNENITNEYRQQFVAEFENSTEVAIKKILFSQLRNMQSEIAADNNKKAKISIENISVTTNDIKEQQIMSRKLKKFPNDKTNENINGTKNQLMENESLIKRNNSELSGNFAQFMRNNSSKENINEVTKILHYETPSAVKESGSYERRKAQNAATQNFNSNFYENSSRVELMETYSEDIQPTLNLNYAKKFTKNYNSSLYQNVSFQKNLHAKQTVTENSLENNNFAPKIETDSKNYQKFAKKLLKNYNNSMHNNVKLFKNRNVTRKSHKNSHASKERNKDLKHVEKVVKNHNSFAHLNEKIMINSKVSYENLPHNISLIKTQSTQNIRIPEEVLQNYNNSAYLNEKLNAAHSIYDNLHENFTQKTKNSSLTNTENLLKNYNSSKVFNENSAKNLSVIQNATLQKLTTYTAANSEAVNNAKKYVANYTDNAFTFNSEKLRTNYNNFKSSEKLMPAKSKRSNGGLRYISESVTAEPLSEYEEISDSLMSTANDNNDINSLETPRVNNTIVKVEKNLKAAISKANNFHIENDTKNNNKSNAKAHTKTYTENNFEISTVALTEEREDIKNLKHEHTTKSFANSVIPATEQTNHLTLTESNENVQQLKNAMGKISENTSKVNSSQKVAENIKNSAQSEVEKLTEIQQFKNETDADKIIQKQLNILEMSKAATTDLKNATKNSINGSVLAYETLVPANFENTLLNVTSLDEIALKSANQTEQINDNFNLMPSKELLKTFNIESTIATHSNDNSTYNYNDNIKRLAIQNETEQKNEEMINGNSSNTKTISNNGVLNSNNNPHSVANSNNSNITWLKAANRTMANNEYSKAKEKYWDVITNVELPILQEVTIASFKTNITINNNNNISKAIYNDSSFTSTMLNLIATTTVQSKTKIPKYPTIPLLILKDLPTTTIATAEIAAATKEYNNDFNYNFPTDVTTPISSLTKKMLLATTKTVAETKNFLNNNAMMLLSTTSSNILAGSSSSTTISTSPAWPVKHASVMEGDVILGGLMMVHSREDTITCGPIMPQGGIQALEAMLYTLDQVNKQQLLPNITLGAHILDDCDKDTYGLEMAVDFIKGSISNIDDAEYHCNKTQVRKVISGVVGAASSVTSIQVANLLRLFRIPQVSFFSTSPELSNKQRFEYFSRTIPSDHYQVKAMVEIVKRMGWSYVSIIYEESNYGIKAFEELEDLLARNNICIAIKEKLVKDSGVAEEFAYDNIVLKLLTKPRARGAIIFGSDQEVREVMRAVRRNNATGAFSWIGSDGWSARNLVSDGNEPEVEGTLSVQPQANPVKGFEEYFLNLTVENNQRNPWFVEFWEDHFQCRYPNSFSTPYNNYNRTCSTNEKVSRDIDFEDQLQFVSDAVMAFAYALRDMHRDLCGGRPSLCDAMKPTKGADLLKYLRKVQFQGLSGDHFRFDGNGDGPARYNIIHFKQSVEGQYHWVKVGEYYEGELRLNMSEVQFKLLHPKPPESVCSLPCERGQAKKYVEGESCCWHCFNCSTYQIRHTSDETQCLTCQLGTLPDLSKQFCQNIPEVYLRPESAWAIGAMAFSSTGMLVTLLVVGVFVRHNDTPVVRASGRELSYILLAGILMCYAVTFALVLKPTNIVCALQRFGVGFCFTVVYAALLTKTNRIARIFKAGKQSAKRPSFISPKSQLVICTFLIFVQILINGVWMVIAPSHAMYHHPTREDNLLVCDSYIDASYMIAFSYPIVLIVVCTVYAILTRKIPEAFNESKHIGFTMYTTCVIWLAFVPLYFGTANHVPLRITSMSVTISLSASVTIACLFSPKLYIIIVRPERNVRQSMMPPRGIHRTAGTGPSSMMAAAVVTAATCAQEEKIQQHITPTNTEHNIKGKKLCEMATQTITLSSIFTNLDTSTYQQIPYADQYVPNSYQHNDVQQQQQHNNKSVSYCAQHVAEEQQNALQQTNENVVANNNKINQEQHNCNQSTATATATATVINNGATTSTELPLSNHIVLQQQQEQQHTTLNDLRTKTATTTL